MDLKLQKQSFDQIRRKLGPCSYQPSGYVINSSTNGTFVSLHYHADCANGPMEENFVWFLSPTRGARLVSYHANSKLLLTD